MHPLFMPIINSRRDSSHPFWTSNVGLLGELKVGMLLTKFLMLWRSCASLLRRATAATTAIVSHCAAPRIATVDLFQGCECIPTTEP